MTTGRRTYYGDLDVREDATPSRIRAAFRKLAKRHHPDRNPGSEDAEATFKRINAAYLVLSDVEKREAYDRTLKEARAIAATQERGSYPGSSVRSKQEAGTVASDGATSSSHGGAAGTSTPTPENSGEIWVWLTALGLSLAIIIMLRFGWVAVAVGVSALAFAAYHRLWARRVPRWSKVLFFGATVLCLIRGVFGESNLFERMVEPKSPRQSAQQARIANWRDEVSLVQLQANFGQLEQAQKLVSEMQREVSAEQSRAMAKVPELEAIAVTLGAHEKALECAIRIRRTIGYAKSLAGNKDWLAADAEYQRAAGSLRELDSSTFNDQTPSGFAGKMREELSRLEQAITGSVALAKDLAYLQLCGPLPELQREGEVAGLKSVIQRRAHDPNSVEVFGCTKPSMSAESCWLFQCNVRGKNTAGAKVLQTRSYQKSALGFHDETPATKHDANLEIEGPAAPNDRPVPHVQKGCCASGFDPDL